MMKSKQVGNNNNQRQSKKNKKFIPTPEEAQIIISYFVHNNFQDFNTWQQISKCKSQYDYAEIKDSWYQCKVVLKWQDPNLPIIAQVGEGKNKRKAKKKVLYKLIQNLIFQGLIGFGFKENDFIKRLPRRRKEDTSSESEEFIEEETQSQVFPIFLQRTANTFLEKITLQNFYEIWIFLLRHRDVEMCVKALRIIQGKDLQVIQSDLSFQEPKQQAWQDYCEKQFKNPNEEDLTEILQYYQLQWNEGKCEPRQRPKFERKKLPYEIFLENKGKNPFQQFYPIDKSLALQKQLREKQKKPQEENINSYFKLKNKIILPKFEQDEEDSFLPYQLVEQIYDSLLFFSYDYKFVTQMLTILERQIQGCVMQTTEDDKKFAQKYYLKQKLTLLGEFSYLVFKKSLLPALSIEGMGNRINKNFIIFHPKQPEEILIQKLSKKTNTNEFEQMTVFSVDQLVLLVSKIDSQDIHIGQIEQISPSIRIKAPTLFQCNLKEKYPFTMYKLVNTKLFNRLGKALIHTVKKNLQLFTKGTFIMVQPPTFPVLSIIYDLLSEWICEGETILLVSEHSEQLHGYLVEEGFKAGKVQAKFDERSISKVQVLCSSPATVCCDMLKNYSFTRVIIEGAHHISELLCLLAIDKGCEKLYLIGDDELPSPPLSSPFNKGKQISSLMVRLMETLQPVTYSSWRQITRYDSSLFHQMNRNFYAGRLNNQGSIATPVAKGFPWPSTIHHFTLIHHKHHPGHKQYLNQQVHLCVSILSNILNSGFMGACQVRFLGSSENIVSLLEMHVNRFLEGEKEVREEVEKEKWKMVDFICGSRFKQTDLCVVAAGPSPLTPCQLNACLQEALRGLIIIGDLSTPMSSPQWGAFVEDASNKQLLLSFT